MKTLIGGAVAVVLGIVGLSVWFKPFLALLAGALPIIILVAGALALYLGFDELKDDWKSNDGIDAPFVDEKDKIAELEAELAALKK